MTAKEIVSRIPCACSDCGMYETKAMEMIAELLKEERKKAYNAIDKAYTELKKMGYDGDMNILAVMIKLQEQFK